jgi:quinol monooxygenase YgiN
MVTTLLTVIVKDGHGARYLAALTALLPDARRAPGCLFLHATESVEVPGVFLLFGSWRDPAAYRAFRLRHARSESLLLGPGVTDALATVAA